MTTYNQKSHEQWKKRAETDIACVLVLADFEMRKSAFLQSTMRYSCLILDDGGRKL